MSVKRAEFRDFTIFKELDLEFSRNINIISGENSIGKTCILKALYSVLKTAEQINSDKQALAAQSRITREKAVEELSGKIMGVFRPDSVGRMVRRKVGRGSASFELETFDGRRCGFDFTTLYKKNVNMTNDIREIGHEGSVVYFPPKEIISAAENFASLYKQYHIAFEETYYDLNLLLNAPLKRGPISARQKKLLKAVERVIEGKVVSENGRFYIQSDKQLGKIEMGLVAEGYRKMATILYLINSDGLREQSVLFWDEPESNINPKMVKPIVDLCVELAKMGVQIFITTHSYFIQQQFSLYSEFLSEKDKINVQFIALYRDDDGEVRYDEGNTVAQLEHDVIAAEFDALYAKEQELFYADN